MHCNVVHFLKLCVNSKVDFRGTNSVTKSHQMHCNVVLFLTALVNSKVDFRGTRGGIKSPQIHQSTKLKSLTPRAQLRCDGGYGQGTKTTEIQVFQRFQQYFKKFLEIFRVFLGFQQYFKKFLEILVVFLGYFQGFLGYFYFLLIFYRFFRGFFSLFSGRFEASREPEVPNNLVGLSG